MISLLKILNEIYVELPQPESKIDSDHGYIIKKQEFDPISGKHTTDLEPEPKLTKFARECGRMVKQLKYYEMMDENPSNKPIIELAMSSVASLRNAEGKLRKLQEMIKAHKEFGK
jgi:hypothetical protein